VKRPRCNHHCCAAHGLRPERNAYWERTARRGRLTSMTVGAFFLTTSVTFFLLIVFPSF